MSNNASTTMHVIDKWEPSSPAVHHLMIDRTVELTPELNLHIAVIGNDSRFPCRASMSRPGHTSIEIVIRHRNDRRLYLTKLRNIVFEIAETIGVHGNNITIELLEGRMAPISLMELGELIVASGNNTTPQAESARDRMMRERRERTQRYADEARRRQERQRASA